MADTTTETPLEQNSALISEIQTLADNLPEAGGSMKWYDVASVATTEETNIISVSQDTEGREISGYHAVAMTISMTIPADETQIENSGYVILQPIFFPTNISPETGNAYRTLISITNWKTVTRVINGVFQGNAKAFYGICNNGFTGVSVNNTIYSGDIFNGLTIRVQATEGHVPVGTKVNVAVLSEGYKA